MRIVILNRDYPRFLEDFYTSDPALCEARYEAQLTARNASLFGSSDFYSHGFKAAGHEAVELHVNNGWMQAAWAREHGLSAELPKPASKGPPRSSFVSRAGGLARRALQPVARRLFPRQILQSEVRVLAAQIEHLKPDIVLNQEMSYVRTSVLKRILPLSSRLVGQIASALPLGEQFGSYNLVISSLPNIVQYFAANGVVAKLSRLAFDPRVLDAVGDSSRDIPVSFVGSLSADHAERVRLVESLARQVPLRIWGNGVQALPSGSPIHDCYEGEAWGAAMYRILSRSRITINHHIDLAEGFSNNMRLFEATGCGALMVVDHGRNLADMFQPGIEVATYRSIQECVDTVLELLATPVVADRMAAAGQQRTLADHTYARRTLELATVFEEI